MTNYCWRYIIILLKSAAKERKEIIIMKKKNLIILICVSAAAVLMAVILTLILKKDYIDKIKYDHVASVSYNGANVVGEDGLFYLEKDGKKISEGYIFLKSVNDYYEDIEEAGAKSENDLILFDFYIAHKPDSPSYYLVTTAGEEYTVVGDNYSLDEVKLPYIIFVNNTTSRKAAISLLKIDSALSRKSGNDLTLTPFLTLSAEKYDDKILYTHLIATDEASRKSLFCDDGTHVVSTSYLETAVFTDGKKQKKTYFIDAEQNAVYSSRGELLAKGNEPMKKVSEIFGTIVRFDEKQNCNVLDVFSVKGVLTFSDSKYDISAVQTYFGALSLPLRESGSGIAIYNVLDGNEIKCAEIELQANGIIRGDLGNSEYVYVSDNGNVLIQTPYQDLVLQTELSGGKTYVFTSEAYNSATNNANAYHFTKVGQKASVMNLGVDESISKLYANKQTEAVEGSFLLTEKKDGKTSYRICTPFAANPWSDTFDSVETFLQAGIYWSRCVSYVRGGYDIIDPISNQKAGSIACTESDFAKLSFEFEGYEQMVSDVYDDKSGVPVLLLSIRRYEDDEGTTSSVRYYALYRSASSSSEDFNSGTLRIAEVGMNLLRSDPFTFFQKDNCLVLNGTGTSRVFRLNDSNILAEAASIPYRIKRIVYDNADSTLLYYLVESEGGNKGLYDKDGNMILAPYYDGIYSLENGRFVVSLKGGVGVLEYRNSKVKQIIDYSYVTIEALADGGYIAIDGNGNCVLYEGDDIIKKDPIQSASVITKYSIADDGTLEIRYDTLLSINGDLYIHESETVYKPKCESFEAPALTYENIGNDRAKLIRYYVDGKVEATEVIYPTEQYVEAYVIKQSPNDAGWYFSTESAKQITPVTKEDILTSSDYMISVYAKTVEK